MSKLSKSLQTFNIDICLEIERIVLKTGMSYIDAVIYYSEKNDLDIDTVAALIKGSQKIKGELQIEGENLNFLKKTDRLPI